MAKTKLNKNRQLFNLAVVAFFAVGAVFAANFLSKNSVGFKSEASTGPIYVTPCEGGDWNKNGCFKLTNISNSPVNLSYFLDCWDETKCEDKKGTVLINPGESVTLGLGLPCSKWQLDINWTGNEGWDWGGVIEISQNCGTPTPTPTPGLPTVSPTPTPKPCVDFIDIRIPVSVVN